MPKEKNKSRGAENPMLGTNELVAALVEEARSHGRTQERERARYEKHMKRLKKRIKQLKKQVEIRDWEIIFTKKQLNQADDRIEEQLGIILDLGMQVGTLTESLRRAKIREGEFGIEIERLNTAISNGDLAIDDLLEEIDVIIDKHQRATDWVAYYKFKAMVRKKAKPKQKKKKRKQA